jgi:hypothetical protein
VIGRRLGVRRQDLLKCCQPGPNDARDKHITQAAKELGNRPATAKPNQTEPDWDLKIEGRCKMQDAVP